MEPDRVYVDHGLTGPNRARPAVREALAACRSGDTLVVTKLSPSATGSPGLLVTPATSLTSSGARAKLNLGGSLHDPADPVGRLLFNVLAWSQSSIQP